MWATSMGLTYFTHSISNSSQSHNTIGKTIDVDGVKTGYPQLIDPFVV